MIYFKSLEAKIISTFCILGLAIAIATGIIVYQINRFNALTTVIIEHQIPTLQVLQKAYDSLQNANESLLLAIIQNNHTVQQLQPYEAQFYNNLAVYSMYYNALLYGSESNEFKNIAGGIVYQSWLFHKEDHDVQILAASESIQAELHSVAVLYYSYVLEGQKVFTLLHNQHIQTLVQNTDALLEIQKNIDHSSVQVSKVLNTIFVRTKNIISLNNQEIQSSVVQVARIQKLLIISILLSFASLLILLLILLSTNRLFIISPIKNLINSTKKFAKGDFAHRSGIHSQDEFGVLATAFNAMASNIQESYDTLEKRVQLQTYSLSQKIQDAHDQRRAMLNIIEDFEESRQSLEQSSRQLEKANQDIAAESLNVKKFKDALDASTNAVAIFDQNLQIIYVNQAWAETTGFAKQASIGSVITSIFDTSTPEKSIEEYKDAVRHNRSFISSQFICRKGEVLYDAKVTLYPVRTGQEAQFFVHIQEDITEQKKIETAKSEFVSLASHQLRTPLTALRWSLDMFLKGKLGPVTETQLQMLQDASQCAHNMSDTVGAMLMLSRLEAGKIHLKEQQIFAEDFWQKVWNNHKAVAAAKKIEVVHTCSPNLSLYTDATLLLEIIQNLLSNALKYTPEHGTIHVSFTQIDTDCHIIVKDSGYGIPKKQQEKIFTKFFRANNILEKVTEGTGLGLYLVHSLVLLLGGSIRFHSEENIGTTFHCIFPILYHE